MSDQRIILITGANTGLGYEAVKAMLKSTRQASIILVGGRSLQKVDDAIAKLQAEHSNSSHKLLPLQVDISDDKSITDAFNKVTADHGRLDVLINNAGANFDFAFTSGQMTQRQAWTTSWDTNVSGTQIMTYTFVPLLLKSADPRLLFVTSGTSSLIETLDADFLNGINKPPPAGWPKDDSALRVAGYRSTKTGLNMVMREWVKILANDGVKVWAISPGFLATGLAGVGADALRKMGALDPSIGGEFISDVVDGKRDADAGKIIRKDSVQPW